MPPGVKVTRNEGHHERARKGEWARIAERTTVTAARGHRAVCVLA